MTTSSIDLTEAELVRRRSQFGALLRDYRLGQQLSGEELATKAELSQPKVSRLETGRVTPNPRDVKKIASALGVHPEKTRDLVIEAEQIADLAKNMRRERARIGLTGLQQEHLESESLYSSFFDFSMGVLPGWVQTPEYARSMLRSLLPRPLDADIDQAVAKRVERQAILRNPSRTFTLLTTPETLRAHFGDEEEMYVQLVHLRSLMRLPNVTLRALDMTRSLPTPLLSNFTVYDEQRVVVELLHTELYVADPTEVAEYRARFDALLDVALDASATAQLIDTELAQLR